MSLPQPRFDIEPSERVLSLRKQKAERRRRAIRTARLRALAWETTGRLTVNLIVSLVALSALVRLVPYHQTQREVLTEVEESVTALRGQNQRLLQEFGRYFDPARTSQVLQENGTRESSQHVPVVWTDSSTERAISTPETEAPSEPAAAE